jgi:hypothetical protein
MDHPADSDRAASVGMDFANIDAQPAKIAGSGNDPDLLSDGRPSG